MSSPLPPFPYISFVTRVAIIGSNNGDDRVTVLHYRHGSTQGPPTPAELTKLCEGVRDIVLPKLRECVSSNTSWHEIKAVYVGNPNGTAATVPLSPVLPGLRNGEASPGNVNICLSKRTGVALRRARGRLFIMDPVEADISVSRVTGGNTLAGMLNLAGVLVVSILGSTHSWRACVASYTYGTFFDIISVAYDLFTDSQYQRLLGKRKSRRRPAPPTP
jgi:hypothetical protein